MSSNHSVLLIDGMSLLFRGFYATSYRGYFMETNAGIPTNAIYGFTRYFWDAINRFEPSHVVCCWDLGRETFRTKLYAEYKANRSDPPPELVPQFELIKEVVASFGIPNVGVSGYEADDCIGTLAKVYSEHEQINVGILTGDQDSLQLISERTDAIIMKKGISNYLVYNPQLLWEEKKLSPEQLVDLKGLMGDSSDNYPGVPGIGEKTALKLLHEYQSIEGILDNLDSLSKSIRTKIENNLELLHLSRDLARIRCDVPVSLPLEECVWSMNIDLVKEQLLELEFDHVLKLIS